MNRLTKSAKQKLKYNIVIAFFVLYTLFLGLMIYIDWRVL